MRAGISVCQWETSSAHFLAGSGCSELVSLGVMEEGNLLVGGVERTTRGCGSVGSHGGRSIGSNVRLVMELAVC